MYEEKGQIEVEDTCMKAKDALMHEGTYGALIANLFAIKVHLSNNGHIYKLRSVE